MYRVRRGSHRTVLFEALKLHKTLQMFLGSVPFEADSAALLCVLTVCCECLGGSCSCTRNDVRITTLTYVVL